ncbi:MAG: PaaI family thioesterase [Sphingomonadales bacterium]|nr:PaaI family thioesterase [Sphingomonadales bacterium]
MTDAEFEAAGWQKLPGTHFNAAAGPHWLRRDAHGPVVGLFTLEHHSNGHLGTVHGGCLMTFADVALGVRVVEAIGEPMCATSQLSYAFAGSARCGQLVTCRPELVRKTSALVFVRGVIRADDKTIGSAEGIFSILDQTRFRRLREGK